MKKINVDEQLHRKVELICFFNQVTKKDFIESLVTDYLEKNPLPKTLKVTKDFVLKVIK